MLKADIIPFVIGQETERLITAKIKLLSKRLAAAYLKLPKIKKSKPLILNVIINNKISPVSSARLFKIHQVLFLSSVVFLNICQMIHLIN